MNLKFNKIILITILGLSQNCFATVNQKSVSLTLKSVTKTVDSLCEIRKENDTSIKNNEEVNGIPFVADADKNTKPTSSPILKVYSNSSNTTMEISDFKDGGLHIKGIGFWRGNGNGLGGAMDMQSGNFRQSGSFKLASAVPIDDPITLIPMFIVENMDKLVEHLKSGDYQASVGITLNCN